MSRITIIDHSDHRPPWKIAQTKVEGPDNTAIITITDIGSPRAYVWIGSDKEFFGTTTVDALRELLRAHTAARRSRRRARRVPA